MDKHLEHINWIRNKHGVTATAARMKNVRGANYEECVEEGTVIAGSPKTVLAEIERHASEIGFNYLLTYLFLGNMTLTDAMRSLKLFTAEVMPTISKLLKRVRRRLTVCRLLLYRPGAIAHWPVLLIGIN